MSDERFQEMTMGEKIADAGRELQRTLLHFQQERELLEVEKLQLGRSIQLHGLLNVKLALIGARYEPKSTTWDPADWVNLDRYLNSKSFKRFLGLGIKHTRSTAAAKKRPSVDWGPLGPPDEPGAA